MPTQTVISINRQTPIMGPATFYPRVVVERLRKMCNLCVWTYSLHNMKKSDLAEREEW